MTAVLRAEALSRVFRSAGGDVVAVREADLAVEAGGCPYVVCQAARAGVVTRDS